MASSISREDYVVKLLKFGDGAMSVLDAREPDFLNSDDFPHLEFRRSGKVDTFFSNN